MNLMPHKETPL